MISTMTTAIATGAGPTGRVLEPNVLDRRTPPEVSPARSVAKAISWRAVGTLDTLVLSFVVLSSLGPLIGLDGADAADNAKMAGSIALTEVLTKTPLYYFHERIWLRLRWGRDLARETGCRVGRRRSLTKTATWRGLASLDTMVLGLVFTGSVATAVSIGAFEIFTKLVLYFFHERGWARVKWGITPTTA